MALSFIGSKSGGHNATSAQSVSLTDLLNSAGATVSPAAGDFVFVTVVHASATGNSRTLAQLTPTGYTANHAASVVAPTAETHVCSLGSFRKEMGGTPDTTITIPACALTTNAISYTIEVWRGLDPANPLGGVTPTTANAQNTGLANPPLINMPASPAGSVVLGCFGAAVAAAAVFTNTGATPYDTTTNMFKSGAQNVGTNRAVSGMGAKTGLAVSASFDAAITGSTTTNTGSWAALSLVIIPLLAPTWTSSSTASVNENATLSYTMAATGASSYSIVGGADQADFEISGSTLRWVGNGTKDFETPDDADTNNSYVVTLRATGAGGTTDLTVTVDVQNVAGPTITSSASVSVAENATLAHTLTVASGSPTWSIVGGADQGKFEISGSTLRWLSNGTKDYEAPDDSDTNNTYVVTVRATDVETNDQTITVTVTDVASPTITSASSANVAENTTLSHALTVASGTPTWSIVGGADQADFEISGSTLRWASNGTKNYEIPDDSDTNNTYVVTVRATDGSETTDQTITVTVTDAAEATPWTPSNLAVPPVEWFDMQDAATVTVSTPQITSIASKGSGGHAAVPLASYPGYDYSATFLNGLPAINATSNFKGLRFSDASMPALFKGSVPSYLRYHNDGTTIRLSLGVQQWNPAGVFVAQDNPHINGFVWTAGTGTAVVTFYENGKVVYQATGLTLTSAGAIFYVADKSPYISGDSIMHPTGTSDVGLFCRVDGVNRYEGFGGEAIFLNYAPTSTEVDYINGYAAHHWNIASVLDAAHPFKSAAPTYTPPATSRRLLARFAYWIT